jgi:hypothetical protein
MPQKLNKTLCKTKRDLKGLGAPSFSSPIDPYFGKQDDMQALISHSGTGRFLQDIPD